MLTARVDAGKLGAARGIKRGAPEVTVSESRAKALPTPCYL